MKRKVYVPGRDMDVKIVLTDAARRGVYAVYHAGEVLVMFSTPTKLVVRLMTMDEAKRFSDDLVKTYEALQDDGKIAQMERDFE